ncbi:Uncharacterized protein Rs2_43628 [Raphanus sativus]|nr:Uncharacterized protein Rs2_43628 [Raphanus sativus]
MKRKRGDGNEKENVPPNAHKNKTPQRISLSRNDNLSPNFSTGSVPVRSIFKRVMHEIGSSPSSITSSSFSPKHQQSTNSNQTPNPKPVRLFASVLPDSRLTSAQTINSKRQRDTPLSVLNDISNIRNSLANTEFGSSLGRSHNQTEHEATDEDDFDEGVCGGEDELDFDCSSQESTDSENDGRDTDGFDFIAHATPATDPYRPEPFCMSKIIERSQKSKRSSVYKKEEGTL